MNNQRLIYLIKKRQQDKCSPAEKAELYELMQNPATEKEILLLWDQLHEEKTLDFSSDESERLYDRILSDPEVDVIIRSKSTNMAKKQRILRLQKIVAAAAVLAIFFSVYFMVFQQISTQEDVLAETSETGAEVMPGSKKATIVFEDGTYQELGSATIDGNDFFVVDGDNEEVSYLESNKKNHRIATRHTLITPIGGEYAIQLADGTKVWLNADSKLTYPTSFYGAAIRGVELEGEAYFEVAKLEVNGKRTPFVVKSKDQTLEVLGTEFNVNTFSNRITTTLIEGSVKVSFDDQPSSQSHVLKPNDQSIYDSQSKKTNITQIDPYYVTAWKTGDFAFDNAPLENIMEDIARWYGVSIAYESDISDVRFSGKVSKFENIETLLQTIEWTGSVKLKLNGRRITVMK